MEISVAMRKKMWFTNRYFHSSNHIKTEISVFFDTFKSMAIRKNWAFLLIFGFLCLRKILGTFQIRNFV